MNRTLVEHWQEHGLTLIDTAYPGGWCWSAKGNELTSAVKSQLERFECGHGVSATMYGSLRTAGFSPHTCRVIGKKTDSRIFILEDFSNMTEPELFSFFALCELDSIELAGPEDHRSVYHNFSMLLHQDGLNGVRKYLAAQRMNKL